MVGVGMYDTTGPIAGTNMMGYAQPSQISQGLHTRLFARAFIFQSNTNNNTNNNTLNSGKRVIFCSCDLAMIQQNIKQRVMQLIQTYLDPSGELYTAQNTLITATHTHSSPAGFHSYLLYSITSLGYIEASADMMVTGIYEAIKRAHENMQKSVVRLGEGVLEGANRNRSPSSYLANAEWERLIYQEEGDTEKQMTLLAIYHSNSNNNGNANNNGDKNNNGDGSSSSLRGAINWFSVHGTSMNNTNRLISGDNKAYASYLLEHHYNSPPSGPYESPYLSPLYHQRIKEGRGFVGAFAQMNEGDSSPNIEGAFCLDTGERCDLEHSTCPDAQGRERNGMCHAHGPGGENGGGDKESSRVIGLRQFFKAQQILTQLSSSKKDYQNRKGHNSNSENDDENVVEGSVLYQHAWIDMSRTKVKLSDGRLVQTCPPARGYSFAAGTTDGPGAFDFRQGDNSTGNALWNTVRRLISTPSKEQAACHMPKPILLNTGEATLPYPWEPTIVDIQIVKIGSVYLLAVPGEFTTMAGRRLKRAVQSVLEEAGAWTPRSRLVVSGLANSYAGYVTTYEEYQKQRYEAASTIYGPYTLDAYMQEFKRLAVAMCAEMGHEIRVDLPPPSHDPRRHPEDFSDKLITLLPPVITDAVPLGKQFGETITDVSQKCYGVGEQVQATFYSGHPRNMVTYQSQVDNAQLENYFMIVEKLQRPEMHLLETDVYSFLKGVIVKSKREQRWWWSRIIFNQDQNGRDDDERSVLEDEIGNWIRAHSKSVDVWCKISAENPRFLDIRLSQDGRTDDELVAKFDIAHLYGAEQWTMVRDDGDWDTEFEWQKPLAAVGPVSMATLKWTITDRPDQPVEPFRLTGEANDMSGMYRLRYRGANRNVFGRISLHEGLSSIFQVVNDRSQCDSFDFHFQINI